MIIKSLKLYTSQLKEQTEFYSKVIGVEIVQKSTTSVTFNIGNSHLIFQFAQKSTPYHFAINIPANKTNEALHWLQSKVKILSDEDGKKIQDFSNWNAEAMYFYDKDHNIVELIARKNLSNHAQQTFSAASLLEISEIGVPSNHIKTQHNFLNELCAIKIFDGNFDHFCAIGDDHGLFICIDKDSKNWFPTGDKAYASDFEICFKEKEIMYNLAYKNMRLQTI
ncbi:VOC family protein [Aquimarina sp. 2-A2]|uniref:VOC family protein n=1 Tax=Aquimarina sp. 2-A2 TaxID=3382644 RepID=UPI00387F3386